MGGFGWVGLGRLLGEFGRVGGRVWGGEWTGLGG